MSDDRSAPTEVIASPNRSYVVMAPLQPVRAGEEYRTGEWPLAAGAEITTPEHTGDGFRAHITDSVDGRIEVGETVTLDSLALLDMRPDGRPDLRRFVGVGSFGADAGS